MTVVRLIEPLGERPLHDADFPVTIGGRGAVILLPGCAPGEVLASIHCVAGRLSLVPAAAAPALQVNQRPVAGEVVLRPGDSIALGSATVSVQVDADLPVLRVHHAAIAADTLPPAGLVAGTIAAGDDCYTIDAIDYRPPAPGSARAIPRRWTRPIAVVLAAVLVLGIAGFLLSAATLTVRTLPELEPDSIDLVDTLFDVRLGQRVMALPGHYRLLVRAAGYAPVQRDVDIGAAGDREVVVPLSRLPGRVRFVLSGAQGVVQGTLSVDGRPRGTVPGWFELPAGRRELAVSAPRHLPWSASFDVKGSGASQTVNVRLVPAFAAVRFESVPAGAQVIIDGRVSGETPLVTAVDAGRRVVQLQHPDFRHWEAPITVRAGQDMTVGPVQLGLPDGTLVLSSQPAGADVSVAGRYRGRTPLTLPLAAGVPHEIVVNKAGHAPLTRSVNLDSRERRALALVLEPVFGEVTVRGEPADAELFVDGVSRGAARQTLRLPAAPHAFEIRRAGLASHRVTVIPRPGLVQIVDYSLQSPAEAQAARLPAVARTSLGGELRLVGGGRFTMGSPRREPGRRSNETQRGVELRRPFYIGVREVINLEFRAFRKSHASGLYKEETLDLDRQPVANVSWADAVAFCNWLSEKEGLRPAYTLNGGRYTLVQPATTGYRLPTEAEWEFVARHDGRAATLRYPWGQELPVKPRSGNYADRTAQYLSPVILPDYDDGARVAAHVGGYTANALGLYDLGGNVSEWVHDRYGIHFAAPGSVAVDPVGPDEGEAHVLRGSSWLTARVADLRVAWREAGTGARPDLGFRLARYAE